MPALNRAVDLNGLGLDAARLKGFVQNLLAWQRVHGRHDLPWHSRDPYRVWLSEIMLQQTQVATVKTYYAAFLARFERLQDLAEAHEDEVLQLWAGLGYYSRARNLHRCAQVVMSDWGGAFPQRAEALQGLPGIGPSTAAAIAAFCFDQRISILDGNVKRVLARWLCLDQDLNSSAGARVADAVAQALVQHVPRDEDMAAYTQGLMDLGATVCQPRQADCERCPLRSDCRAHRSGEPLRWPVPKAKLKRQTLRWSLLFARDTQGQWAWQRRSAGGIWGGLMVPMITEQVGPLERWPALRRLDLPMFKHVLTHRDLMLYPVILDGVSRSDLPADLTWCDLATSTALAQPKAIQRVWPDVVAAVASTPEGQR